MRVAYACRDLASDSATGIGAQTFACAAAMAAAGHHVHLVSAELALPWQRRLAGSGCLTWRPVLGERADHLYFTDRHSYADRVYDTILAMHGEAPLDVVHVPDAGGEALTLLRAKRLLRQFTSTCLAVSLHPEATVHEGPDARWPTTFATALTAYAEAYSRKHADLVLSARHADGDWDVPGIDAGRARRYLQGLPHPGVHPCRGLADVGDHPGVTVLWLGPVRPGAGLGTVLRAVALARRQGSRLRLVLRGEDTLTDPLGRSYWQHLRDRLDESMRQAVTFEGPLRVEELTALPAAGTQCVLAAGSIGNPMEALLAMVAGYRVIAQAGSVAAGLVRGAKVGALVVDWEPGAVADALLGGVHALSGAMQPAVDSAQAVRNRHSWRRVAERLAEIYGSAATSAGAARPAGHPPDTVSVVIPVHNDARFLSATLESVRHSGLVEPEIVVVDDGSTDPRTLSVLGSTAGVTHVRQPHRGLSAARNRGIAAASGSLVLVLDADDMVAPGYLPMAVDALNRCGDLAFVAGYVRYFGLLDLVYVPAGPAGTLSLVLHTHLKSAVLYRREALVRIGGYDERLPAFEDWEIQIRLALAGDDSDVLPMEGQLYRRHAGSMSFRASNGMRSELVQYLVRKHAPALDKSQLVALLADVVDLWKTGYEPSRSVLLQRAGWTASDPVDDA